MNTPLIMLVLMLTPYLLISLISAVKGRDLGRRSAAAVGLGLLFLFTGMGHFVQTAAMAQMLPPWVPQRTLLVYLTGILEFALAAGFFVPTWQRHAGWAAAVVIVLLFPANLYAAWNHIPMGGHEQGPTYLLIRAPLQILILLWTHWSTIRQPRPASTGASSSLSAPTPLPRA